MEKLTKQYNDLVKIYQRLIDIVKKYKEICADNNADLLTKEDIQYSIIKRFELTYELLWRYLREYVIITINIDANTPHRVFRSMFIVEYNEQIRNRWVG